MSKLKTKKIKIGPKRASLNLKIVKAHNGYVALTESECYQHPLLDGHLWVSKSKKGLVSVLKEATDNLLT